MFDYQNTDALSSCHRCESFGQVAGYVAQTRSAKAVSASSAAVHCATKFSGIANAEVRPIGDTP